MPEQHIPDNYTPLTFDQRPTTQDIGSYAEALFDGYVAHLPEQRPTISVIHPGQPAQHFAPQAEFDGNVAVITVALRSGFRYRADHPDLASALKAIAADPFQHLNDAHQPLKNGRKMTLHHVAGYADDFSYAAALGLRNIILAAVMHDLLLAVATERISQRLKQGVTLDQAALHRRVFLHKTRGLTLEQRLRDDLDDFTNAIIASGPYGAALRKLLKTVTFIVRLHDSGSSIRPC